MLFSMQFGKRNWTYFNFNALAESLDGNKHGEAWFEKTVGPMSGLEYLTYEASVHYEKQNKSDMV